MSKLEVPGTSPASSLGGGTGSVSGNDSDDEKTAMGYQQTLMYGRYSKSLGEYAKEEAKRQKMVERRRRRQSRRRQAELTGEKSRGRFYRNAAKIITYVWKHTFAKIGEDWVFLAVLGIVMAFISFVMDLGIDQCGSSKSKLYNTVKEQNYHMVLQFMSWVILPVSLVLFSAGFVHVVAPQAIGSGIPEMKTILRGVVLKEYLTGKTLIAKMVGLTATLGSGMPLGKEGPFVHIASIVATLLTSMVTTFQGIYSNESRHSEMLAAACAVGVACCFASPIGGVLFSIEVTSVFFAVRNYWRGFFAAVCGATMFRLLFVITSNTEETITAVFRTDFKVEYPYDPRELIAFAGIGVVSGLGGALYVYTHRRYVLWMRANKRLTTFLQKNRFIYPFTIALLISGLSFPPFLGQYIASTLNTHDQVHDLFSNHSWTDESTISTGHQASMLDHWTTPATTVFTNLTIYILMTFFLSILAATLPVPTGVLIPAFKIGAAFGRMVGEGMNVWFPGGFQYADNTFKHHVVAGGYATVGAASFTGAVTHTISISVIVFEMTGQITHLIPVLISVLISNAVAALLQPSCYDSIILIKKLPYLPDILPSSSNAYNVFVEDFMLRDIKYIWYGMTYKELRDVLKAGKKLRSFPLVDNPDSMILLGSIQRMELIQAIERLIGKPRRLRVAMKRYEDHLRRMAEEERKRVIADKEQKRLQEEKWKEEEEKKKQDTNKTRRPSRFEVTALEDASSEKQEDKEATSSSPDAAQRRPSFLDSLGLDPNSPAMKALMQLSAKPKKSILKKSNSYTIHSFGVPGVSTSAPSRNTTSPSFVDDSSWRKRFPSAGQHAYRTVTGAENTKWKNALDNFHSMFRKPSQMSVYDKSHDLLSIVAAPGAGQDVSDYSGAYPRIDMSLDEQQVWEEQEMANSVEFDETHIDPAPFQLVEKTSLLKVHSLFSMVGVNHAYVTAIGRLIGVVGLKELRSGIENANAGNVPSLSSLAAAAPSEPTTPSPDEEDPESKDSSPTEVIAHDPQGDGDVAVNRLPNRNEVDSDSEHSDSELLEEKGEKSKRKMSV